MYFANFQFSACMAISVSPLLKSVITQFIFMKLFQIFIRIGLMAIRKFGDIRSINGAALIFSKEDESDLCIMDTLISQHSFNIF